MIDLKAACIAIAFTICIATVAIGTIRYAANESKTYQIRVFSDPETGCEYLVLENEAISPRVDNRGGIICKELKREGFWKGP